MTASLRAPLLVALRVGGLGFVAGGGWALWAFFHDQWVREFQAGDRAPLAERLGALAQRAAIEASGFAALGLVAGILALALARGPAESRRPRYAAAALHVLGALVLWITTGTWLARDFVPLLEPLPLTLLNAGGVLGLLVAVRGVDALVRRVGWIRRTPLEAGALGAALGVGLGLAVAEEQLFGGAERTPLRWGLALAALLAAAPVAALSARLLAPLVSALGARSEQGPLVPRGVRVALTALFALSLAASLPQLELSSLPAELEYARHDPNRTELSDHPNVVLVTVDTLRADHLGCYGYGRPTSPFLDSVAAEGALFTDPSAPAAWTKPSTGTILTGLYPSRHGALYHGSVLQVPEGERTLAEVFRQRGYVTAGFVTNPNVKKVFEFDRGFDEYFDSFVEDTVTLAAIRGSLFGRALMRLTRHQFNWKYENDVLQMNRHIVPWLEHNRDRRFFLYLHYIDPHTPYHPPTAYREDFVQDHGLVLHNRRKELVGMDLYDAEIRYTDDGLRQLAGEMQRLGLWDDTLFVVTSDHGEEFFEHGYDGHGFSLFQPVVGVPLIARGPGVPPGARIAEPVQIVDLAATVADLAGVLAGELAGGGSSGAASAAGDGAAAAARPRLGDGRSFRRLLSDGAWTPTEPFFLENEFGMGQAEHHSFVFKGVREGPWKLVRTERNKYFPESARRDGGLALYNLETDPEERENLIRDERYRDLIQRLVGRLLDHTEFLELRGRRGQAGGPLSKEMEDDLRALGYL